MNTFLIILTVLSLGFAFVLLAVNWSLLREAQRRSAARVQALVEAAAESSIPVATAPIAAAPPILTAAPIVRAAAPIEDPGADEFLQVARDPGAERIAASPHEMFHTTVQPPPSFRRLALPISLGIAIVGTIVSGLAIWSHERPTAAPVQVAAVESSVPLELIALRHERTVNGLSITGLVRNPSSGHRITDVDVWVFLFDRSGALITSVRAPLDFRTLAPGDESPFVVSLDKVGTIGRYRVSFKSGNKLVPHLDRRLDPVVAVASSQ